MRSTSKKYTIYVALVGNVVITVTKFVASAFTGSSAMISEGIHSAVDTMDSILLLVGQKRSERAPDESHRFGYGLELYFWTMIVSIVIFAFGGAASIYEGISHLYQPHPIEKPLWSYLTFGVAYIAEGSSLIVAWRRFKKIQKSPTVWLSVRNTKDPTTFTIVFEDGAAVIGLTLALLALIFGQITGNLYLDGIASILIGLMLMAAAFVLMRESKELLAGESVRPAVRKQIEETILTHPEISTVIDVLTLHFGPHTVLTIAVVKLGRDMPMAELFELRERIREHLKSKIDDIKYFYMEARGPHCPDTRTQ